MTALPAESQFVELSRPGRIKYDPPTGQDINVTDVMQAIIFDPKTPGSAGKAGKISRTLVPIPFSFPSSFSAFLTPEQNSVQVSAKRRVF